MTRMSLPRGVAWAVLLVAALAGCPAEKDGPAGPQLTVSATAVAFGPITAGAVTPGAQTVDVGYTGGGTLVSAYAAVRYSGTVAGWLDAGLSSSRSALALSLQPLGTALPPGTHRATVEVGATGAAPATLTVEYTVVADTVNPVIALDAATVTFTAPAGGPSPAPREVTISNAGIGTLDAPTMNDDAAWLSATFSGGAITLQADTTGLAAGFHSAVLQITIANATPATVYVPVLLHVTQPTLAAPRYVGVTAAKGSGPASRFFAVLNAGSGAMAPPTVTSLVPWLTATVVGERAPFTVLLTADPSTLDPGSYTAPLTVDSAGASNTPLVVTVALDVTLPPVARDARTAGGASAVIADALLARRADCGKWGASEVYAQGRDTDSDARRIQDSWRAGRIAFRAEALSSCLSMIQAAPCEALADGVSALCESVFAPLVPDGGRCAWKGDCASGLCGGETCPLRCLPKREDGWPCSSSADCLSGTCDYVAGCVTIRPGAEGEPCVWGDRPCQPGLFCWYGLLLPPGAICRPLRAEGEECEQYEACRPGLSCAPNRTCRPLAAVGESCAMGSAACGFGAYCSPASGLCTDGPWKVGDVCEETGHCLFTRCDAGTCAPGTLPAGAACDPAMLAVPYCVAGTFCGQAYGLYGVKTCQPIYEAPYCP